ncbi:MAG: DUF3048 domain-containing protein [Chloroflexi bacterium]|nr:DUF3048 domain-containing protein [Chloroflexota bacterium]MCI0647709.1 DUF3048 domain-containing protein [Chloroflexota bacterium]
MKFYSVTTRSHRWPVGFISFCLVLLALLLLVACSQGQAPLPTLAPTAVAQITAVPSPTATAVPLTATASPTVAPTATRPPSPTPAPSPTPTATPSIAMWATAEEFGETRNPLTGELVADPAVLNRRPLAIKISNAPAGYVRPQSGLNDADLIFEHITEWGITRFTMIVYSQTPPKVGPIRSARLIDLELPAMFDAALAYSGSSAGVAQRLFASDFRDRILTTAGRGYYRTGENKPFEHTLYGYPETFWNVLTEKGLNVRPAFTSYMAFSEAVPEGGAPARTIDINYRSTFVRWQYDPATGRYLRWADGERHRDGNSNEQVSAANVVVVFAVHIEDPTVCEQSSNGVCVHLSVQSQIWGTGSGIIFRDGLRYDVTWRRENRSDMLTFYGPDGNPLPLHVGNSWFQVVPVSYVDAVTVAP